jgi:hypothetical protein
MFAESQRYGQASLALRNLVGDAYVVEILEPSVSVLENNYFADFARSVSVRHFRLMCEQTGEQR